MAKQATNHSMSFVIAAPVSDPGLKLHQLVVDHMMELGNAGGVNVWWRPIANPSLSDPIYRSLRSPELAKRDQANAREYLRLCKCAGSEASYQKGEYLELAREHGISHQQRPAIILVASPAAGKAVVLPIAPSALETAEQRRDLACFLYVELAESRMQQFAVDGVYSAESMKELQKHARKVSEAIAKTIAKGKPVSARHWRTYLVQCGLEVREDPARHTVASAWRRNGKLVLRTFTDGKVDGEAEFALVDGQLTKQARLVWLLLLKWPSGIPFRQLAMDLYEDEFDAAQRSGASLQMQTVAKRVRALIHDVRFLKLEPAGINPDILPTVLVVGSRRTTVALQLQDLDRTQLGRSQLR